MRILLAAADRDLLECYQQILSDRFGETVTAFDGTQVFMLLGTEHFDLVILDRDLPRMDHQSLVRRIRGKETPVMVLTNGTEGRAETGQPQEDCLAYPFMPGEIIAAVEKLLRKAGKTDGEEQDPEKPEEMKGVPEDESGC